MKKLTLTSQGEPPLPPLVIATRDQRGFTPFSIALYRGHFHLARVIVEISAAQYHPKDDDPNTRQRYHLRSGYDSDDDSVESDDSINVFSELVTKTTLSMTWVL